MERKTKVFWIHMYRPKSCSDSFLQRSHDCEAGKIDIVLTKSISRFARNTVNLLETVRHLKELGIEVQFEKEHINSLSDDGELIRIWLRQKYIERTMVLSSSRPQSNARSDRFICQYI